MKNIFVILGNQLFDPQVLKNLGFCDVFMAEVMICVLMKNTIN